jgi:septum formation protein
LTNHYSGTYLQAPVILASSSVFRKSLLERLHIPFECYSPEIDESLQPGETAKSYVTRLALQKAQAIAEQFPDAVIVASDQCALLDNQILGKPGNHENALEQLKAAQGKTVVFHTGICVLQQPTGLSEVDDILFQVKFRQLSVSQLDHYLRIEQPYQCAGAFKSEGYGVCLFDQMLGDDPSALIGLPLIRLIKMLEKAGITVV